MIGMLQGVGHYICLWIGQKFLSPVDAAGSTETIGKDSSLLSMTGCYLCLEIEKEMVMGNPGSPVRAKQQVLIVSVHILPGEIRKRILVYPIQDGLHAQTCVCACKREIQKVKKHERNSRRREAASCRVVTVRRELFLISTGETTHIANMTDSNHIRVCDLFGLSSKFSSSISQLLQKHGGIGYSILRFLLCHFIIQHSRLAEMLPQLESCIPIHRGKIVLEILHSQQQENMDEAPSSTLVAGPGADA